MSLLYFRYPRSPQKRSVYIKNIFIFEETDYVTMKKASKPLKVSKRLFMKKSCLLMMIADKEVMSTIVI